MRLSLSLCTALAAAVLTPVAQPAVVPNTLFSDHAVLQQGCDLPVWGTAKDGERVTVELAAQKAATVAKDGRWLVRLKALPAGGPYTMTIAGEGSVIKISDLLVGEVWVCSGQSNMERQLGLREGQKPIVNWEQEVAAANYPQIRQFYVPQKSALSPAASVDGKWVVCSPQTVADFTAVGYFFGRDLFQARHAPVGLIHSSWGGTPAEAWTSQEALRTLPDFAGPVAQIERIASDIKAGTYNYGRLVDDWFTANDADVPRPPSDYRTSPATPGVLYNGMIAPLLPYSIRGVIWYQGEANVGREKQYRTLFPTMIADWRRSWGEGDFPFLFVQIAPFKGMTPEIREAQLLSWQHTPNTAMAVTIDCGDADDIHPARKQPMGARLALAARALAYGEALEYSGPVFTSMQSVGRRAILSFTHLGGGLVAKDGPLTGFTIAGTDKVFHPARAVIEGETVAVLADEVSQPVAVRYGWANVPEGDLFNAAGLPASPFRTDVD